MPITQSYPKPRDNIIYKFFEILRTDNGTEKCVLPKGATVVDIEVCQQVNAASAAGSFSVGWAGTANALINAFSMATTAVGLVKPGTAVGASFGAVLSADRTITSTYTVGSSTGGGTGWVKIGYLVAGPGEGMYS